MVGVEIEINSMLTQHSTELELELGLSLAIMHLQNNF